MTILLMKIKEKQTAKNIPESSTWMQLCIGVKNCQLKRLFAASLENDAAHIDQVLNLTQKTGLIF